MTTLAAERSEQRKWTARLGRPEPAFDKLIENEFEAPAQFRARVAKALATMLHFASQKVPYYREAFRRAGIGAIDRDPMSVLSALPILTKLDVQDNAAALQAESLPRGHRIGKWMQSSGTTGRPTRVLHSVTSRTMFGFLKQREYRWFRFDPSGSLATMRLPGHTSSRTDRIALARGETVRSSGWGSVGPYPTGAFMAISSTIPVEERLQWLRRERPDYLIAYSETLEFLGFAAGAERPAQSLKAVLAISEQLTPGMRAFVERRFGVPVHQNYGLNEIGLVGVRCEAGRYHVHGECSLVEIVDQEGRACAPGETGHLVVTSLTNSAMPLLRYDTSDLAQAVDGPCSCNRTLPSFGEIVGRYSRAAHLPDGTMGTVLALRGAIENMPADLMHGFREFQIYEFRDRHMELRMVTQTPMPEEFFTRIREVWAKVTAGSGHELVSCYVDEIPRSPGGKHDVFLSDFMPSRDGETSALDAEKASGSDRD